MAKGLVKSMHQKDTFYDSLNMFVQNLSSFLSSIVNAIGCIRYLSIS